MEEVRDKTLGKSKRPKEVKESADLELVDNIQADKLELIENVAKVELDDNVQVAATERKRRRKGFENGETTVGKKRRRNKEEVSSTTTDEVAEKVKVENLPLPVLEKVFFYLDWKELGTAMLVCKSWQEVGRHFGLDSSSFHTFTFHTFTF